MGTTGPPSGLVRLIKPGCMEPIEFWSGTNKLATGGRKKQLALNEKKVHNTTAPVDRSCLLVAPTSKPWQAITCRVSCWLCDGELRAMHG